jgi:hypothetical protein
MNPALMRNSGAWLLPEGEGGDETAADDTYLTGAIIDRHLVGNPQSCTGVVGVAFTSSSGASGASVTLTMEVLGDSDSAMGSATSLGSKTYEYTWAADGANVGFHTLPVDLWASTDERYIRIRAKLTKAGTITVAQALTMGILVGGMDVVPDPEHTSTGVDRTTEAS